MHPLLTSTPIEAMTDLTAEPIKLFLYRTQDRGLAAAFMALGFQLVRLEPADRGATFLFAISQELLDAADAYMST